jgi:hypothetical protein
MENITIQDKNGNQLTVSQSAWDSVYSKRPEKYSLVSGGGATTTTSSKSSDSQINQLYQQYVGRNATSAELANWRNETPQSLDSFLQKDVATWKSQNQSSTTPVAPTNTISINGNDVDISGLNDRDKELAKFIAETYLPQKQSSGDTINPDLKIDDATIQRFLDQATSEVAPYYGQLFTQAKADIQNSLDQTKQSYERSISDIGRSYGAALENTQEDFGQRGLQFSSDRTKSEESIATGANRAIEDATTTAQQQARQYGTSAERTLGSSNMPSLNTSVIAGRTLQLGTPGQFGLTGGSSRDLFSASGNDTVGSLEYNKNQDIATKKQNFINEELARKAGEYYK